MKKFGVLIVGLVMLIIGMIVFARTMIYPLNNKDIIKKYGEKYNVDPILIAAVIHFETNFEAVEYVEGKPSGLMKITDEAGIKIAKEMGENLYKREQVAENDTNIRLGTWYISQSYTDKNYNEMMANWIIRNGKEDKEMIDYARKYYAERIDQRVKVYKFLYPELRK